MLRTLIVGSIAGLAGDEALKRVGAFLYERTDPADVAREQELEPREPFVALAHKVNRSLGLGLSGPTEEHAGRLLATGYGLGGGIAYQLLAQRVRPGWVLGGAVFGTLFWLLGDELAGPALGLVGDNTAYPAEAHLRGLASHVAFGMVAAALVELLDSPRDLAKRQPG